MSEENRENQQETYGFQQEENRFNSQQEDSQFNSQQEDSRFDSYQEDSRFDSYQTDSRFEERQTDDRFNSSQMDDRFEQEQRFYQSGERAWQPEEERQNYNGYNNGYNLKPPKKKNRFAVTVACILAIALIGLGCFYAVDRFGRDFNELIAAETPSDSSQGSSNRVENVKPVPDNDVQLSIADKTDNNTSGGIYITDVSGVVKNVMPSIVAITSKTLVESYNYGPWYSGEDYYSQGAGSGIIIGQTDDELLIVTNKHVVSGATSLEVQFIDESTIEAYTKAISSDNDIAIVSIPISAIDNTTLDAIKIATIGDSQALEVGNGIIAIGNALGYGQSVTVGVVSALNRVVQLDDDTQTEMIQIDAAINGGNSGGALLNSRGEVVGINAAKYSSTGYSSASIEGMGFAIPISDVVEEIEELMNKETRYKVEESRRGYLGVAGGNISSDINQLLGYPLGFCITEIYEGGAADKAGMEVQDIIVGFDGTKISNYDDLAEVMEYYAYGETVEVVVARRNARTGRFEEITLNVTLCEAMK